MSSNSRTRSFKPGAPAPLSAAAFSASSQFPSLYSMTADEDIEEERRLFYVAITRAKQNLYVSYPVNVYDRTSGMVLSKPSRFIEEVRPDCLESWSLLDEDDFRD